MTEKNPPYVLQNRTDHKSDMFRLMLAGLMGRAEGVFGPSDLLVTQDTGANMNCRVGVGGAFMFGDESITQGGYAGYNDASVALTHGAAPGTPGQSRYDLVCARVRDQIYSGATNAWDLVVVPGTASGGTPADPGLPSNAIALARVTVAYGQITITNTNIADLRPRYFSPGGIAVVNSGRRPGDLYGPFSLNALGGPAQRSLAEGDFWYEPDTDKVYLFDGAAAQQWMKFGPWQTWSPVFYASEGGTPTPGNGIAVGRYQQIGKTIHWVFTFQIGSTTSFGIGSLFFSLPVACFSSSIPIGSGLCYDVSTATAYMTYVQSSAPSDRAGMFCHGTGALTASATIPFLWDTSGQVDLMRFSGTYEIA